MDFWRRFSVHLLSRLAVWQELQRRCPFHGVKARKLMSKIVEEDGVRLGVDVTEWHAYRL